MRTIIVAACDDQEVVFEADDNAGHVYFVLSGFVKEQNFGSSGGFVHIKRYKAGDYFGFGPAFTKAQRACRASVDGSAVLGKLGNVDFIDIFLADRVLATDLCLRFALFERECVLIRTGEHTLHIQELVAFDLMRRREVVASDTVEVPPRDEWAAYLGTTRESLSRALSDLRKCDLIQIVDSTVTISDPAGLDALVKGELA